MSFNQVVTTVVLGVVASFIFFFVQKGFLDDRFFRNDAKSAAESAQIEAYKAEALRRQEAAARAKAEAEAERIRRTAIEEDSRINNQRIQEENRRARVQAEIEARRASDRAAIERANLRRAYRAQNGGCDLGTHRVCMQVGGAAGYNAGCFCQRD